jgi:hypothetical protein
MEMVVDMDRWKHGSGEIERNEIERNEIERGLSGLGRFALILRKVPKIR